MALEQPINFDTDSEDDEDYVPPISEQDGGNDSDVSGDERASKKRKVVVNLSPERIANSEETRKALWDEFNAPTASTSVNKVAAEINRMIKIPITYRFAGEDVVQMKEVAEDSDEARKWLSSRITTASTGTSSPAGELDPLSHNGTVNATLPDQTSRLDILNDIIPSAPKKLLPPRRTNKKSLASLAAATKPRKITTLEKSKIDWQAHVQDAPPDLKDELEQNKRSGGYLDKIDFLQRVEDRKEEVREAGKRRR